MQSSEWLGKTNRLVTSVKPSGFCKPEQLLKPKLKWRNKNLENGGKETGVSSLLWSVDLLFAPTLQCNVIFAIFSSWWTRCPRSISICICHISHVEPWRWTCCLRSSGRWSSWTAAGQTSASASQPSSVALPSTVSNVREEVLDEFSEQLQRGLKAYFENGSKLGSTNTELRICSGPGWRAPSRASRSSSTPSWSCPAPASWSCSRCPASKGSPFRWNMCTLLRSGEDF